jgi:hypothetical protein
MDPFTRLWEQTNERIERELRSGGETMLPGDPTFDALSAQLDRNRRSRSEYESRMSEQVPWSIRA